MVPHVVGEIRQLPRFWWKLVEILYKAYAIGIKVLFYKIIKVATSQHQLARVLKMSPTTRGTTLMLHFWAKTFPYISNSYKYTQKIRVRGIVCYLGMVKHLDKSVLTAETSILIGKLEREILACRAPPAIFLSTRYDSVRGSRPLLYAPQMEDMVTVGTVPHCMMCPYCLTANHTLICSTG